MDPLQFRDLRDANLTRVALYRTGDSDHLNSWSETDWACAAAGEMGEMCNFIKKRRRGEDIPLETVGKEMADTVIYIDLLAARMGIDLGMAVRRKFNEVSLRDPNTAHIFL